MYCFILRLMQSLTGQKIVLPFYHNVSNKSLAHLKYLYNVRSIEHFEKDLKIFLKHYKPLSAEDLANPIPENLKGFHISFDDGFAENYTIVAPILKKYGVPASFFVSTSFIDNRDLMYRCKASVILDQLYKKQPNQLLAKELSKLLSCTDSLEAIHQQILKISYSQKHILNVIAQTLELSFDEYLKNEQPYLSIGQVKELSEMGFTIGSHSTDHPYYPEISLKDQIYQTKQSVELIHSWIDQKLKLFSFPFGDDGVRLSFFSEIQKEICPPLKLTFGTAGLKNDSVPGHYHRIPMERFNTSAVNVLLEQYTKYMIKAPLLKNRMKRGI